MSDERPESEPEQPKPSEDSSMGACWRTKVKRCSPALTTSTDGPCYQQ